MGWIISVIFATLVSGALFLIGRALRRSGDPEIAPWGLGLKIAAPVVFLLWAGLHTGFASVHQVPVGNVGVLYTFSDITGQTDAGFQFIMPWQSIKPANVQIQTLCFGDFTDPQSKCPEGARQVGPGLDSFSSETQNVFIDAVLRIKVDPNDVQGLYRNVGENYVNKLIPGSIAQVFKDETVDYKAVDIAPNREKIRRNVERDITGELSRFSITVDALLIENIAFDPTFEVAIQEKQNATQEAFKEKELVEAKRAQADQAIETARGEAEAVLINARALAEANRLLAESLTPDLIRFQMIQKLADNVTIALVPSLDTIILDSKPFFEEKE